MQFSRTTSKSSSYENLRYVSEVDEDQLRLTGMETT